MQVSSVGLAFIVSFSFAASVQAQVVNACVNPSSGEIRIAATCQPHWKAISWSLAPPSASTGGTLVAEHSWATGTSVACCSWRDVDNSGFSGETHGGALLIAVKIYMRGGSQSHSTCQPLIDGQWAGGYGSLPNPGGLGDIFWKEGLVFTSSVWLAWTPSRVYPGVAAGSHNFSLQCATDLGTVLVGQETIPSAISVIELK